MGRNHHRGPDVSDAGLPRAAGNEHRAHLDSALDQCRIEARQSLVVPPVGEARDQARVICFLASRDADFVTGVTIDVTGGI